MSIYVMTTVDTTSTSSATASGHVTEECVEESRFDEVDVSEQTIRETQTFVITGVHDPRQDSVISIYEAIADGIISQTQVSHVTSSATCTSVRRRSGT